MDVCMPDCKMLTGALPGSKVVVVIGGLGLL